MAGKFLFKFGFLSRYIAYSCLVSYPCVSLSYGSMLSVLLLYDILFSKCSCLGAICNFLKISSRAWLIISVISPCLNPHYTFIDSVVWSSYFNSKACTHLIILYLFIWTLLNSNSEETNWISYDGWVGSDKSMLFLLLQVERT